MKRILLVAWSDVTERRTKSGHSGAAAREIGRTGSERTHTRTPHAELAACHIVYTISVIVILPVLLRHPRTPFPGPDLPRQIFFLIKRISNVSTTLTIGAQWRFLLVNLQFPN